MGDIALMVAFLGIPLLAKFGGFLGGAQMGLGYTSGAYAGYGISNTWDPFNLHKKGFNSPAIIPKDMPYGSYGRRRYSRNYRYGRSYPGYTRYRRYRRRSYRSRYY